MNATPDRLLGPLIIRADASTQIGKGHVMRCVALAQAWQGAGGQVAFVRAMEAPAMEARLQSEGMEVVHLSAEPGGADDATQTADLARQMEAAWVVLDGYHFGADYQRIIKESSLHLLAIDDNGHADHYCADIVLNQNIHAHRDLYRSKESYTRLLLGTRYVLLRREFLRWQGWKREIAGVARKVLVTLGGGDPNNVTLKVIQALQQVEVDRLEAVVVIGGNNPHYGELQDAVRESQLAIRLEKRVTDMPPLMAWADMAVSAGGSTCWELAFMGVPTVVLVLAENQQHIAAGLDQAGVVLNLGSHTRVSAGQVAAAVAALVEDPAVRRQISERGIELVDGLGSERVTKSLRTQSHPDPLSG